MEEFKEIRQRSQIPVEDTWALEDIFADDEAWEQMLSALELDREVLSAFDGHLADSGEKLCAYLSKMEEVGEKTGLLANYCMRKSDEDTRDAHYQGMVGRLMSTVVALRAALSFETPEIMAISDDVLDSFYEAYPALERYRRYLTDLRRYKAHVLSPAEEKLLAAAGELAQAPDNIYGMFADADLTFADAVDSKGNKHPVSQSTFAVC